MRTLSTLAALATLPLATPEDKAFLANCALQSIQSTVDALTDPVTGGRYVVHPAGGSTAATDLRDRHVYVTMKPIRDLDERRTDSHQVMRALDVLAGLTLHEVGHARYDPARRPALDAAFGSLTGSASDLMEEVDNLLGDDCNERTLVAEYGGWLGAFDDPLAWVAGQNPVPVVPVRWGDLSPLGFAICAARYADLTPWDETDARVMDEVVWWVEWSRTYAPAFAPVDLYVEGIRAGIERIGSIPKKHRPDGPTPPPPPGPKGEKPEGPTRPGGDEPPPKGDPTDDDDEPKDKPKGEPKPGGGGNPAPDDEPKDDDEGKGEDKGDDEPKPDVPLEKPERPSHEGGKHTASGPTPDTDDPAEDREAQRFADLMDWDAKLPRIAEGDFGRVKLDWR